MRITLQDMNKQKRNILVVTLSGKYIPKFHFKWKIGKPPYTPVHKVHVDVSRKILVKTVH